MERHRRWRASFRQTFGSSPQIVKFQSAYASSHFRYGPDILQAQGYWDLGALRYLCYCTKMPPVRETVVYMNNCIGIRWSVLLFPHCTGFPDNFRSLALAALMTTKGMFCRYIQVVRRSQTRLRWQIASEITLVALIWCCMAGYFRMGLLVVQPSFQSPVSLA